MKFNLVQEAQLYVQLPEHGDGRVNLTTFAPEFFGWDKKLPPVELPYSLLTRYAATGGAEQTKAMAARLLDEDPNEILITDSASQALSLAFLHARSEGLHCVIPKPWFPSFYTLPSMLDCQASLYNPFNVEEAHSLEKSEQSKIGRLVVSNTPSNPVGKDIPEESAHVLANLARSPKTTVIWDLSYYWASPKYYRKKPEGIRIYSLGKMMGLPGMRLGVLVCPDPTLRKRLSAIKRQLALHSCPLSESFFCQVSEDAHLPTLHALWRSSLTARAQQLARALGEEHFGSATGPFVIIPTDLCHDTNILGVPGEAFGLSKSNTRICLACSCSQWNTFIGSLQHKEQK